MQSKPENPQKRQFTKKQLRTLRRKRRQEKRRAVLLLLFTVAACIIAAAVILQPKEDESIPIASIIAASITPAPSPVPTASPEPTAIIPAVRQTAVPDAATPAPTEEAAPAPTEEAPAAETPAAEPSSAPTPEPAATPAAPMRSVHFRVTGDIMATEDQLDYAKRADGNGGYDFRPQLELIAGSLQAADYTVGNLETTIGKYGDRDYSGYPEFNSPESLLTALSGSGFDMLSLANNHMLDRWFDGMKNTVNNVEAAGFDHVGAYRTREERNSAKIVEINGVKFGFLAYTGTANDREKSSAEGALLYGVPFLHKADFDGDVERLRAAGAEVVIAFPHWGAEYVSSPNSDQQHYAMKLAEAGADIIIGSHPHVLQPMGFIEVDGREVFIAFSMGNFLTTQSHSGYTDAGMILDFTVTEQPDGGFRVENVGYVPTWCWEHGRTVQVLPAAKYVNQRPDGMDNDDYNRMKKCLSATVKTMGDSFTMLEE